MSKWKENRKRARTFNTDETLTDQAAARDTDINVIVGRFTKTGMVPVAQDKPMGGDFVDMPTDLRGFIEAARKQAYIRTQLPVELRDMEPAELLALTPEEIAKKLKKPDTKPDTIEGTK